MRRGEKKGQLLIILLVVGFFVGVIWENTAAGRNDTSVEIFCAEQLTMFQELEIEERAYLIYIIKKRMGPLFFLFLLWNYKWRKPVLAVGIFWCGIWFGRIIVSSVISHGLKGIIVCLAAQLPQTVFYALAYIILVNYLYSDKTRWWNKGKTSAVIVLFLLGILMEVYINPSLFKRVIGWF